MVTNDRQRAIEDHLHEKWKRWIEQVYAETVTLFSYRSYYRGVGEITRGNPNVPPSSFFTAFGTWYVTTQVIAVRRQIDLDPQAVSLARLLSNMRDNSGVMSRVRFGAMSGPEEHWQQRAHQTYDKFAGRGADAISADRYQADLDELQTLTAPIKKYVDRVVAHTDQRELTELPTYEDLNAALELLGWMLNKYMVLLKDTSVPSADPVHQADWKAAFTVPWLQT